MTHNRVLVCGSRTWATGNKKINAYDYSNGPQFDPDTPEFKFTVSVINGLYLTYSDVAEDEDGPFVIIEGAAPGADSIAWWWAEEFAPLGGGADREHLHFPANWYPHGKDGNFDRSAGYKRNAQMLHEGKPNLVIAFTRDFEKSKGTKMMVELAEKAGVETYVLG